MKKMVAFFEIPCSDFNRAITFYEVLFGVELSVYDYEDEKMAFFSDETSPSCGAISWAENFKPSKDGVLISFSCENMDKSLDLIEQNGGEVLIPKTRIESDGRGYFSVFIDCEGNRVGLWSQK